MTRRHTDELTILRAFAAQMLAMGAQHKFDTRLQAFYCVLCEAAAKPGMDTEIEHKDGCLVPIVEDMPISSDGRVTESETDH